MNEALFSLKKRVMKHIDEIWTEEPLDIFYIKNGYSPSGAGVHKQYFTTTVMLSGEIRALGVHIFPDILKFARSGNFTLEQLKQMVNTMLVVDIGVIAYFGLEAYGELLLNYHQNAEAIETTEDFIEITNEMFTLTNRYQLWLHQIFPWYLLKHFPKISKEEVDSLLAEKSKSQIHRGKFHGE